MEIANIIALTTIVITLIMNFIQNAKISDQMKLQMFSEYTKRYQDIMFNLPLNYFQNDFTYSKSDEKIKIKKYLRMYFDLSSEEYYLFKSKKIDDKVWNEWKSGILENLNNENIKKELNTIGIRKEFYSEFIIFLKENNILSIYESKK